MDQSSDSAFLAVRAARVNARCRADSRSLNIDTTSTSMLDQSTISVPSSLWDTTIGSTINHPSHYSQQQRQLQRNRTTMDAHNHSDFFSANFSDEFLRSLSNYGNGSIANDNHLPRSQLDSSADRTSYLEYANRRSFNTDSGSILPPSSSSTCISSPSPYHAPISYGSVHAHEMRDASLADRHAYRALVATAARMNHMTEYGSSLMERHENSLAAPTAPVLRPRTFSSLSSNNSSSGSSGRDANECSYCLSVNKPYAGHNKHNCPVLAALPPCRICQAQGKYNHTESHCPFQKKTDLEFIPKDRRRIHATR